MWSICAMGLEQFGYITFQNLQTWSDHVHMDIFYWRLCGADRLNKMTYGMTLIRMSWRNMLTQTMLFLCMQNKGQWRWSVECWTEGQILWGMSFHQEGSVSSFWMCCGYLIWCLLSLCRFQEFKCPDMLAEHYKPSSCRISQWISEHALLIFPVCAAVYHSKRQPLMLMF